MVENKNIKKSAKKPAKAFEHFLCIFVQLRRCRFNLIILEKKFRWKSQSTGVEKTLFRTESDIEAN